MVASKKQLKNSNIGLIIVMVMFGIFVGIFAFMMIKEYSFYKNTEKVYGEINNISVSTRYTRRGGRTTTYTYYVNYVTADGQKYNNIKAKYNGGLRGSNYSKGTPVVVCYNKSNPKEVGLMGYSMNIAYIVIVVIFAGIAIFMLYPISKNSKKIKLIKFLMNNGIMGTAQITNITSKKSGKNISYIIDCVAVHPLTNQQFYSSGQVQSIKNLGINYQVNAYFDPKEPEIYFIDLD